MNGGVLIDTNVLSELRRGSRCDPNVAAWYAAVAEADLYLSALVVGEIRKGIEGARRSDPVKSESLERWLSSVVDGFGDRVLGIDWRVADTWGRRAAHRTVPVIDALLAATAEVHGLTLVTRSVSDVADLGVPVLNPFAARA